MSAYRLAIKDYSQIAIYERDPKKAVLHISLDNNILFINLASITGCTFHSIRDRGVEGFTEGVVADVLLGLILFVICWSA
jgi:hypothetical protein